MIVILNFNYIFSSDLLCFYQSLTRVISRGIKVKISFLYFNKIWN